jgi:hypothetical protein
MFCSVLKAALAAVALAAVASAANAQVVSIQLQESGVPTEFIGSRTSTANFSGNFGTFSISSLDATSSNALLGLTRPISVQSKQFLGHKPPSLNTFQITPPA